MPSLVGFVEEASGRTLLYVACESAQVRFELHLKTPRFTLLLAFPTTQEECIRILLTAGATCLVKELSKGWAPIHAAVTANNVGCAQELLLHDDCETREHVNMQTDEGDTPLMLAVRSRFNDMASALLEQGAGIHYNIIVYTKDCHFGTGIRDPNYFRVNGDNWPKRIQ